MLFLVLAFAAIVVNAQDPAPGWLGYATANCPAGTRITHMEANWNVGATPQVSNAFFSPWFGIDATDNLNLLQPVNPWFGSQWYIYTEYYQWSPSHNRDSTMHTTTAGDQLFGQITFNGEQSQSYTLSQQDVTGSKQSSMTVGVQQNQAGTGYKNYTVAYVVYEKVARCSEYPPDGKVTFSNIKIYCDGGLLTPSWTTSYVEDVCNNRAHVIDANTIQITWDTSSEDPKPHQFEANNRGRGLLRRNP